MQNQNQNNDFKISDDTNEISIFIIDGLIDHHIITEENRQIAKKIAAEELEIQNSIRGIGKLNKNKKSFFTKVIKKIIE